MANKKATSKKTNSGATKKTTIKKTSSNTSVKKSVPKKAQKVSYRNTAKKPASSLVTPSKWLFLGLAAGWAFLGYGFASWAIDSGSLWHYLFTFISVYFLVSYVQRFLKAQFSK